MPIARPTPSPTSQSFIPVAAMLVLLTGCPATPDDQRTGTPAQPMAEDPTLPTQFTVSQAYVFVPQWAGAEGFAAGTQYVIQGDTFGQPDTKWKGGQQFTALPADGSPALTFEIVAESLKSEHIAVRPAGAAGQRFGGESTHLWLVHEGPDAQPFDLDKAQLIPSLDGTHRPHGEGEHALQVAIDLNGDRKPDYAEFSHHCKAEEAPYPITDEARAAWQSQHGEVDWDSTCTNVFTIRGGEWTKEGRKTPQ